MKQGRRDRKDRFTRINEALESIYLEAKWRNRKGDHLFGYGVEAIDAREVTSRAAGGPVMKTFQCEPGVRGIRGMSMLVDRLTELQKVEEELLRNA